MDMEINPYFYSLMKHKLKKEQMKSWTKISGLF
jgi:hypothetical protein